MEEDIYNMKLHETLRPNTGLGSFMILRVPGGWIYNFLEKEGLTATFVPFNKEFEKKKAPLPLVPLQKDTGFHEF